MSVKEVTKKIQYHFAFYNIMTGLRLTVRLPSQVNRCTVRGENQRKSELFLLSSHSFHHSVFSWTPGWTVFTPFLLTMFIFWVTASLSRYSVAFISPGRTHIYLPPRVTVWMFQQNHKHNSWPCPRSSLIFAPNLISYNTYCWSLWSKQSSQKES